MAYGSNMSREQMRFRCPNAELITVTTLPEYRLVFTGEPGRSYANIVKDQNSSIPVMLWKINTDDEASLDRYEDFPNFYDKRYIDFEGETVMFYEMLPSFGLGIPSKEYFAIIENAYINEGCNPVNLHDALAECIQNLKV